VPLIPNSPNLGNYPQRSKKQLEKKGFFFGVSLAIAIFLNPSLNKFLYNKDQFTGL
jgi:hypothetical protein